MEIIARHWSEISALVFYGFWLGAGFCWFCLLAWAVYQIPKAIYKVYKAFTMRRIYHAVK